MRLWSIHPEYLDAKGLTALWREALLAQKVLRRKTKGYRFHPQLERFRGYPDPLSAISFYLLCVCNEADRRGYLFKKDKIFKKRVRIRRKIGVTRGQIRFEWRHLKKKLKTRDAGQHRRIATVKRIKPHPLFRVTKGPVASWERIRRNKR